MKVGFVFEDPEKFPNECETNFENLQSWKRLLWCHSQLVAVSDMATLMSFFSVTAAVELQIQKGFASPDLITAFVSTTCLLVGMTVLVRIISSSILPHLESVSGSGSDINRSPHDTLFTLIHLTCIMGQTLAPFLFCLDLILISWIKFKHFSFEAPLAVTAIMIPVQIAILLFGRVMYKRTMKFKTKGGYHLLPNRRYSEIAETWDEDDEKDLEEEKEDVGLLSHSYSSATSYGAIVIKKDSYASQMKVYSDYLNV